MARPSKYKPEYLAQAKKLCGLGATDKEIAEFFEVDCATWYRWKNTHKQLCEATKVAKAAADDRVERKLYERALGYEHEEVDIRVVSNEVVMTPIKKVYPPDVTAAIFWLKNRRGDAWRDIKAVEVGNKDGIPFLVTMSDADLEL